MLDNGLPVLIHEDHRCPIVAVNLWYHVGSKNEQPGRTGFAHLFEHLMFEGSEHYDHGYFQPLQQAGAVLNGSTNADRTNYWEVVPTQQPRTGAVDGIGPDGLPAARADRSEVPQPARRGAERAAPELREPALRHGDHGHRCDALFPPDHPYHWLTIGSADDLRAASLDDVRGVLRTLLSPRQRVARARRRHRHRRGAAAGRSVLRRHRARAGRRVGGRRRAGAACEVRLVLEDSVELPRLYLNWHSPAIFAPGDAELDLVADVLADGKSSRLYETLVYERRIATDVTAVQQSRELSGFFQVIATAAPGHTLAELDEPITARARRVAESGPTRRGARAQPRAGRGAVRLPAADGRRVRRQVRPAEPVQRVRRRPRLLRAATWTATARRRRSPCRDACRRFLAGGPRVAVSVVPRGRLDLALPDSTKVVCS